MEWLSEEEKSRSMMPYLLDLPPMDSTEGTSKATVTELHETKDEPFKSKTASKVSAKEIETEKWPCLSAGIQVLNQIEPILPSSDTNTYKVDCDTNQKFLYDLKVSKPKKFLAFTDSDMEILRQLILWNKIKYVKDKKLA